MSNIFILTWGGKKSQRQLVEDITSWYINTKLPRYKNLNIEIDLEKIDDAQGFCTEIDKREFHIQIDKRLEGDDFITCVFHELVHVKQHLKKELKDDNGCFSMWKGKEIHHGDSNYYELPWEKEAYELQETLLKEYKNA